MTKAFEALKDRLAEAGCEVTDIAPGEFSAMFADLERQRHLADIEAVHEMARYSENVVELAVKLLELAGPGHGHLGGVPPLFLVLSQGLLANNMITDSYVWAIE